MKKRPLLSVLVARYPEVEEKELYARILCGEVVFGGERIRDPGRKVVPDAPVEFERERYVSRGGYKLEHALDFWNIDPTGKVFIDAGCSTGGFTDCLLQHQVKHVHAVDVGYNQLDYKLRKDPRVTVHERTSIMDFPSSSPEPDAGVADLSFRSVVDAAGHLLELVRERWGIILVKPQFEITQPDDEFRGVLSSPKQLREILKRVIEALWSRKVYTADLVESPLRGRKGNREFLFSITLEQTGSEAAVIEKAVHLV